MCDLCVFCSDIIERVEAEHSHGDIIELVRRIFPGERRSDKLDFCAFIAYLASLWAIKYNVHPSDFMGMMIDLSASVYAQVTEEKLAALKSVEEEMGKPHGGVH